MKAIVLAAGVGSRLRPLTTRRPKHLLEIAGKPILGRIIDQLISHEDVTEVLVVVNYLADQIISFLSETYPDAPIQIVEQPKPEGTGDAVDVALQASTSMDSFAVINGDVLFGQVLGEFIDASEGGSLIVGTKVADPTSFGVLEHQGGKLIQITEKPKDADPDSLVNAGFYIFPPEAAPMFRELGYSVRGEREMTDVIDQLVEAEHDIRVYPTTGAWFDVGKPWQVLDANEYFMDLEQGSYQVLGNVEPNVQLHGMVHIAESARVRSGAYIEGPVYIDEGADIGPNCYIRGRTYLGKDTRIGNGCEVKNSVIYEDTHAAHLSYIGDSILGRSSNLGAGTITANLRHDGGNVKVSIKGNRVDSGRRKLGVIMGDHVKTGIGVDILPGVKISAKTWLNAGEVITRDK